MIRIHYKDKKTKETWSIDMSDKEFSWEYVEHYLKTTWKIFLYTTHINEPKQNKTEERVWLKTIQEIMENSKKFRTKRQKYLDTHYKWLLD